MLISYLQIGHFFSQMHLFRNIERPAESYHLFGNIAESYHLFGDIAESYHFFGDIAESYHFFGDIAESYHLFGDIEKTAESYHLFGEPAESYLELHYWISWDWHFLLSVSAIYYRFGFYFDFPVFFDS